MFTIRKSQDRGYADHGWLKSFHSFSFAGYRDAQFMGWSNLRVINEDRIEAGKGFGEHSHQNMEIISYVLSGELAHRDSLGNVKGIPPGDVQRMSAGTGVQHSEFNHAAGQQTHFLQIWLLPNQQGVQPSYEQKTVPTQHKQGALVLIASEQGQGDAVKIYADAKLYAGMFNQAQTASLTLDPKRKAYVHLIKGELMVNNISLSAGDALFVSDETELTMTDGRDAEVLIFDLAV